MKQQLARLSIALLLAGCSATGPAAEKEAPRAPIPPGPPSTDSVPSRSTEVVSERRLIWTVDLRLSAGDTGVAVRHIEDLVIARNGYVSAFDARPVGTAFSYELTLRVPVPELENTLEEIKQLDVEVEWERRQTQDVTDRFIDHQARLRTLQATEAELRGLLEESRQRGHKADDIMSIYRELTEIRSRIEQEQGAVDMLQKLTALATVTVALSPLDSARPVLSERWDLFETVRWSARLLVTLARSLVKFWIVLVIVILPLAALVSVPLWGLFKGGRSLIRKGRRRSGQ